MRSRLFGTDGVRGIANQEPVTVELALQLGRAIGRTAKTRSGDNATILIGKDTRISGYMLESALSAGICSTGAHVLLCGPLPTPAIAFLTCDMRCDFGVVISASHNPFEDNGIKFFLNDGYKLTDDQEDEIERLALSSENGSSRPTGRGVGRSARVSDAVGRYIVALKGSIPKSMNLSGIRIALDCANGAAYKTAPMLFRELGAEVFAMGDHPDGVNINRECGSLHPEHVTDLVKAHGAHLGIALDGDADRVIFVDETGTVVNGDQIMGLIAWDRQRKGRLRGPGIVATVMSNMGLEIALQEMNLSLLRTAVGDRYVVERMRADGFNFGGEQSGHLVFLDHSTTGDGLLAALQTLYVLLDTGKPLSELARRVTMFPQALKNVEVTERRDLGSVPEVRSAIAHAEALLGARGRILVRYSGTQLLCRVMAEGEHEDIVRNVVDTVADAITRYV